MKLSPKTLLRSLVCGLTVAASSACQATPPETALSQAASPEEFFQTLYELSQPGPEHARLAELVGTFDADVTVWTTPEDPPTRSKDRIENKWILGRRYVLGEYTGSFMDQPIEGLFILGFDRSRELYFSTWADTTSTWFMPFSHGELRGDTLVLERDMYDPMLGGMTRVRERIVLETPDRHRYELSYTQPDGREVTSKRIIYTRVSA